MESITEIMVQMNDEVPILVKKYTEEIEQLDKKVATIMREVKLKSYQYTKNMKNFTREQRSKKYAELAKMMEEADEHSEKKVTLARDLYDNVDEKIKLMDDADKHFREQRALSTKQAEEQLASMPSPDRKDGKSRKDKKRTLGAEIKASRMAEGEEFMKHVPVIPPLSENAEMPIDPNEPTYCTCHSVSFGQMVACDNKDCPTEWFHFSCVGLTESPNGIWYCDSCRPNMPKRKK